MRASDCRLASEVLGRAVTGLARVGLQRDDLITDEIAGAVAQFGKIGRDGEVHQKARPCAISWVNSSRPVPIPVSGA